MTGPEALATIVANPVAEPATGDSSRCWLGVSSGTTASSVVTSLPPNSRARELQTWAASSTSSRTAMATFIAPLSMLAMKTAPTTSPTKIHGSSRRIRPQSACRR